MSYRSARTGRLVLLRWIRPDAHDVEPILDDLRRAGAELGRRPFLAAIMPEDSETPSLSDGRAMSSRLEDAFALVESVYTVLEGSSVRAIAKRLVVDALITVSAHRRRTMVCSTLDEVITHLGSALEASRTDVHATASRLFRDA